VSAAVIVVDQLTKAAILAAFREATGGRRALPEPRADVQHRAAFSFLAGASGWQRWFFAVIAVGRVDSDRGAVRRGGNAVYSAGLALILGGALGNLYDRLALGRSSISAVPLRGLGVSRVNVADSAITVGAALLIIDSFRRRRHEPAEAPKGTR